MVDDAGAPLGWIDADGLRRHRGGRVAVRQHRCPSVRCSARSGNLSHALDAALSSPTSVGVAVDDEGKVIGGVLAADVLAAVEARRRT